ncbi:MAG TPA: DUF4268 domain-containing protein [Acidobacteriota bacterium]|nr:DUF4268 domain-containing protein [Acidobacteriota bacterium]
MLYTYDKKSKSISPCEATEFRLQGLLERQDLSKWVERCPTILGEELLIITTEYDRFDRTSERLDLLAIDKDGNLVVIELKRDDSGKHVDLQAIKYASYCSTLSLSDLVDMYICYQRQKGTEISLDASRNAILDFIKNEDFEELNDRPRIILVAKDFRPEVTASVLWLRKFGMDISCVKLEPYKFLEHYIIFNASVLIPLPEAKDYIIQTEKKDIVEHTKNLTQTEYVQFFSQCVEQIKKQIPRDYASPSPRNYYPISAGINGVHFEWGFHGRPRSSLGVELHFEKASKQENEELVSLFVQHVAQFEAIIGENVIIEKEWGKTWSRIFVQKQEGKITDDLRDWAVQKMCMMIQYFQPELDKLKSR